MGSEKVIAVLLIIAIVFSVASIVINLGSSNYKPASEVSYQPNNGVTSGADASNVNLVVEASGKWVKEIVYLH